MNHDSHDPGDAGVRQERMYHPGAPIALISEQEQEMVPVGRAEVRQFAAEVLTVARNPLENLSAWTIGSWSIAATAALSLVVLYGTKSSTVKAAGWVLDAHWIAVIAFLGIGGVCRWMDSKLRADRVDQCRELSDRIKAVDKRAPVVAPAVESESKPRQEDG
jgi:hypothetical protein